MKKLFFYLPLAALLFAAACDKDDDDEPYIIEIPEYVNLTTLDIEDVITATNTFMFSNKSNKMEQVESVKCTSSALQIKFPALPATKYLFNAYDNMGDVYSVSDKKAMIGSISGMQVDRGFGLNPLLWLLFDGDFDFGYVIFYYSDRDVIINGTIDDNDRSEKYENVTLRKGWNKVACRKYMDGRPEGALPKRTYYSMDIPTDAYWAVTYPF